MPKLKANEIITQGHVRQFIQFGGPSPLNQCLYAGKDAEYMKVEAVTVPDGTGSIDPIWVNDPRNAKRYKLVGRKVKAPGLAKADVIMMERHGYIPRQLQKLNCPINLYQPVGECKDLSNFLRGWSDYILIYSQGEIDADKSLGNRSEFDAENALEDKLPFKWSDIYPIGAISFAANAAPLITREVIDVVFGSTEQCGDCGPTDDGVQRIYAVTKSTGATPGTPARIVYTLNNGGSWTNQAIDGIGDIEDPQAIDLVGPYLVVVTRTAGGVTTGGYYYAEINANTGIPGTFTKVTTGFVATLQPYDIYVLSNDEVFICADGGYIYKIVDITVGVDTVVSPGNVTATALQRIAGREDTIIAVGGSGVVLKSTNRGKTFFTTITNPVVATLQAAAVVDTNIYWVGAANGTLWYTVNGGETWAQKPFTGSGAGQVRDIVFVTPECGFFSHDTATPTGRIFSTWDGGRDWTKDSPRLMNLPVANRFNRIAFPAVENAGVAANNIVPAGLAGDGTSGVLLVGNVSRV